MAKITSYYIYSTIMLIQNKIPLSFIRYNLRLKYTNPSREALEQGSRGAEGQRRKNANVSLTKVLGWQSYLLDHPKFGSN
ncbi:hypothetical protein, partial [Nostoc sp. FACHB-888]|uniref:hypothetical protein n=1 Tax=Nostoc sp. FACHB-888 TaxID=2692842 RepID=UPI001A7E36EC